MWLWTTFIAAEIMYDNSVVMNYWMHILEIAFLQLPFCLWGGYWAGRGMQAFANAMRQ